MQWRGHSHTWEDLGLSIPNRALGIPKMAQPWGFEAFENISKVKFFGVRFNLVSPLFKSYIIPTLDIFGFYLWHLTAYIRIISTSCPFWDPAVRCFSIRQTWDQFERNKEMFGITSTYSEELRVSGDPESWGSSWRMGSVDRSPKITVSRLESLIGITNCQ